jgi:hypothetical protein
VKKCPSSGVSEWGLGSSFWRGRNIGGFGIHLAKQEEIEQNKRDETLGELHRKFEESTMEQARMSGQLKAMKEITESFSKTGIPGFKELAEAIANVVQRNGKRSGEEQPAGRGELSFGRYGGSIR